MFYELGILAVGNLARARARLLMTSGGVLVGTCAVILLLALTAGLQRAAESSIGSSSSLTELEVYPNYRPMPNGEFPEQVPQLTLEAVQSFWQIPGVQAVIPIKMLQAGEIRAGRLVGYSSIQGIDPRVLPYINLQVQAGELAMERGDVLIGAQAGDFFYDPNQQPDDEFQQTAVNLFEEDFKLKLYQYTGMAPAERNVAPTARGLLAPNDRFNYSILMPIQDVIAYNEWISGAETDPKTFVYDQVIVQASSRETVSDVSRAIAEKGFLAGGMGEYINQLNSFFNAMRVALGGVGGIALLVAAFGVANTMTMAILERTREIGLMKAVGATDRDVLTVFLVEAGLVGLVGGLAGVGLAIFLQNTINQAVLQLSQNQDPNQGGVFFLPFDPSRVGGDLLVIQTELALFALMLATAVGLFAGFYPALRAARLQPVLALKTE